MKLRIKNGLEDVQQRLLNNAVTNSGNSQASLPTPRFGYRYPSHRLGAVRLGPQFVNKTINFLSHFRCKISYRLTVDSGRTLRLTDFRKRPSQGSVIQ
jgi:hypothetical protein